MVLFNPKAQFRKVIFVTPALFSNNPLESFAKTEPEPLRTLIPSNSIGIAFPLIHIAG